MSHRGAIARVEVFRRNTQMEAIELKPESQSVLRRNLLLVASYILLMVLIAISYGS
jgi:hypothetical protein